MILDRPARPITETLGGTDATCRQRQAEAHDGAACARTQALALSVCARVLHEIWMFDEPYSSSPTPYSLSCLVSCLSDPISLSLPYRSSRVS
jgi:hypothetical protein